MTDPAFLSADNVCVSLAGRAVLDGVSFALPRRRLVALVGPNGAGKTTLLRALAGLIPACGHIAISGDDLSALSLRKRARLLGYLPQGHVVHWPLPVHDVVALGRYPHGATNPARLAASDSAAVARAMVAADVTDFAARPVNELSGGERGRVALARVLALEAPVMLADEPTASLDPRYQIEIMQRLRSAATAGMLVIVVTHDLGLAARFADIVLVLGQGKLVANGSAAEALSDRIIGDVFRVGAYRAEHLDAAVIVPWSEL